ncbi:Uncharacterised protein [Acinetobacter baumannii]|nr:Uncharacterised protein [Acinetobacter baumannii]
MGPSARPIRIEPAIIIPGVMRPSTASQAPRPSTRDCRAMRRYLLSALIRAARSLARLCWSRNAWCSRSQRPRMLPSMPIASITSALRRLLLASWPDLIDNSPALASGARVARSLNQARAIRASAPTSESRPSQGSKRKITSR